MIYSSTCKQKCLTKLPGRAFKDRWNTLIAESIEPLFACHVA